MRSNQNIMTVDWNKEMIVVDGVNCISSLTIAKMFGIKGKDKAGKVLYNKPHKNIIKSLIGDATRKGAIQQREELFDSYVESGQIEVDLGSTNVASRLDKMRAKFVSEYYKVSSYIDSRGKTQKKYLLTEEGFYNLTFQYKGLQAEKIRNHVIENFIAQRKVIEKNKMRAELLAELPEYHIARTEGKVKRRTLTDTIKDYIVTERRKEGKDDGRAYVHYSNLINKILNITAPAKGVPVRSILSPKQLKDVEDLENKIADLIVKYAEEGVHYSEYYRLVKLELEK